MNANDKWGIWARVLLGAAIVGATVLAFRSRPDPTQADASTSPSSAPAQGNTGSMPFGDLPSGHPPLTGVPPGHPPISASGEAQGAANAPAEHPESAILWNVPKRWQEVPHVSAMRIATYRIPHAPGDAEDPEVSVTRVGGDTEANAARWLAQFDARGQKAARRSERVVSGLKIVVVEVEGEYAGMGDQGTEPGWALLGAIVETPPPSHFFKMTGPAKSVRAARGELDALLASIHAR